MVTLIFTLITLFTLTVVFGFVTYRIRDDPASMITALAAAGFFIWFCVTAVQLTQLIDKFMGWSL